MRVTAEVDMTPKLLAEAFCEMDDENQAQFFIEAAALMKTWTSGHRSMQAYKIGEHLRTCECSTYEARALVQEIADAVGT